MGRRGPAPKPTNLRLLHGDRKDRVNDAEPRPSTSAVEPPRWLPADALAIWREYAPDLVRKGVLTAWDVEAFAVCCDAAARRRRAVAVLQRDGEVLELPVFDKNGKLTGHRLGRSPWLLVLNQADAQLQRWAARFGLTPSDRTQLGGGDGRRSDPKEDLLSG
ncbi:MAG TPA: phage terminase small subunit P27 family [Micromonosporaceae bacterium]|nr:phage terminase small subunit P27 family [Micromonosporaceae bacterium]